MFALPVAKRADPSVRRAPAAPEQARSAADRHRGTGLRRIAAGPGSASEADAAFPLRSSTGIRFSEFVVGRANDPLEREADRVAGAVAAGPAGREGRGGGAERPPVPASVFPVLAEAGAPLDGALRAEMEGRIGADFSRVRVHTGPAAARSASDVGAAAYLVGNQIVFGTGAFSPGAASGRWLLAHELTHVAQHRAGAAPALRRSPGPPPIPTTLPGYLDDAQLAKRAKDIFEGMMTGIAKRPGITAKAVERLRGTFTVGVLQGLRNGKLVTMVAVNTSEHLDLLRAMIGSGAEIVEPIELQKMHARFEDRPTKSKRWRANVHSEQVLAGEATDRALSVSRVATSRPGCREICMSTLEEFYPHVRHVNPQGAPKLRPKPPGGGGGPARAKSLEAAFSGDGLATSESKALAERVRLAAAADKAEKVAIVADDIERAAKAGRETKLVSFADEARKAGFTARMGGKLVKGVSLLGKAADLLTPSPLDVLGLWIDMFSSLAQAKAKLRAESYMSGFCLGISARLLRLDAFDATRMLQWRSTPSIGERVAGWEGVRDRGHWEGVRAGWTLWNVANPAQRQVLLDLRRGIVRGKRIRIGKEAPLAFNFDDVLELGLLLRPTMEAWLRQAAEEERARAELESARRYLEFTEATWRSSSK